MNLRYVIRFVVTMIVALGAVLVALWLWRRYEVEPWTRDGRVRADIVQVAPDVNGLVTAVYVRDNQTVVRGQVLFVVDRPRFILALAQAEAAVQTQRVALEQARRESRRNHGLGNLVSAELTEQGDARVNQVGAALAEAQAARDTARLNLERTTVRSPVDGVAANVVLEPGDYATAGHPLLGVVALSSLHVDGYFEETKLPRIHVGDAVDVRLMGDSAVLTGHVQSIAAGIEDRERSASSNLLPNVNPTFSWVRLAQRIPVRIALDHVPPNVRLIAGRTATVTVRPGSGAQSPAQ